MLALCGALEGGAWFDGRAMSARSLKKIELRRNGGAVLRDSGNPFTWWLGCSSFGGHRHHSLAMLRFLHIGRGCTGVGLANFFHRELDPVFLALDCNHTTLPL